MNSSSDNFDWLIQARMKNQKVLLRLYRLMENPSAVLKADSKTVDAPIGLLAGAAFSLWRAAFLSNTKRSREAVHNAARDVLKTILEDNAITYPGDKRMQEWMGGYYLNGARFRLVQTWEKLVIHNPQLKPSTSIQQFLSLDKKGIQEGDLMDAWNICHAALGDMIGNLECLIRSKGTPNE